MPHRERHTWVEEISKINKKINQTAGARGPSLGGGSLGGGFGGGPAPSSSGFDLRQPDDDDD